MLNHIVLMGRLTKDPELRTTQSGTSVASFTVACERDFAAQGQQRETDFVDIVCWKQGAEFVSKYFGKGQMIVVDGRLQSRKWQDRDGNNRTNWEVVADHTYFGEPKRDDRSGYQAPPSGNSYAAPPSANRSLPDPPAPQYQQQTFTDLPDDDGELPF